MPPSSTNNNPTSLLDFLQAAQKQLADAGVDNPVLDSRLLTAHALGYDRLQLLTQSNDTMSKMDLLKASVLIARRAAHEPVGRIMGLREFWGLEFGLNEATLEPRPDSETLIETALKLCPPSDITRILDLGTGTGCLLLSLLNEYPNVTGMGIDVAPRAVEQASLNAQKLDLASRATFKVGNWFEGIEDVFDILISNPPYIRHGEIAHLETDVRAHDPILALDGGIDGLAPYRHMIPQLQRFLKPRGVVIFEIGYDQTHDVSALLTAAGFSEVTVHKDLGGNDRLCHGA